MCCLMPSTTTAWMGDTSHGRVDSACWLPGVQEMHMHSGGIRLQQITHVVVSVLRGMHGWCQKNDACVCR